jgi:lysozyme
MADPMEISDAGLALIKASEGYHKALPDGRCQAYLDTLASPPIWTIGWGCTKGITEGMIWTKAKAEQELRKEVRRHTVDIDELVTVPLTQNQYDALASFQYNTGGLAKSTLLKKLNKEDYAGAAAEFAKWNKAGGKVWPGLVTRRAKEAELFLKPDDHAESTMPQRVDAPAPVVGALKGSRTVFGILLSKIFLVALWLKDWVLGAASEITALAPVKEVATSLGIPGATILFGLAVAGLAIALFARIDDAAKGATVK